MVWIRLAYRISAFPLVHRISRIPVRTLIVNSARGAHHDPHPVYTFASPTNDGLASFNINNAPAYLFSTIKDIQSVNSGIKVHLIPWSPVSVKFPRGQNPVS